MGQATGKFLAKCPEQFLVSYFKKLEMFIEWSLLPETVMFVWVKGEMSLLDNMFGLTSLGRKTSKGKA